MWIIFALGASVLWGLSYVLFEQIYKKMTVATSLAIVCFVMFVTTLAWSWLAGYLKPDLVALTSSKRLFWLFAAVTVKSLAPEIRIF